MGCQHLRHLVNARLAVYLREVREVMKPVVLLVFFGQFPLYPPLQISITGSRDNSKPRDESKDEPKDASDIG